MGCTVSGHIFIPLEHVITCPSPVFVKFILLWYVLSILTCIAVSHIKVLLVPVIYSVFFCHLDHPQWPVRKTPSQGDESNWKLLFSKNKLCTRIYIYIYIYIYMCVCVCIIDIHTYIYIMWQKLHLQTWIKNVDIEINNKECVTTICWSDVFLTVHHSTV